MVSLRRRSNLERKLFLQLNRLTWRELCHDPDKKETIIQRRGLRSTAALCKCRHRGRPTIVLKKKKGRKGRREEREREKEKEGEDFQLRSKTVGRERREVILRE